MGAGDADLATTWRDLYAEVLALASPDGATDVAARLHAFGDSVGREALVNVLTAVTDRSRLGWALYQMDFDTFCIAGAAVMTDEEIAAGYRAYSLDHAPWTDWSTQLLIDMDERDWDRVWKIVLLIIGHASGRDDSILEYVGAGPREDWLWGQAELRLDDILAAITADDRLAATICVPDLPGWFPEASRRIAEAVAAKLGP